MARKQARGVLVLASIAIFAAWSAAGAAPPAANELDASVARTFVKHCLACHSGGDPSGGLDLSRADAAAKGGDSGPALVAGKPDESPIVTRIAAGEMPPEGKAPRVAAADLKALEAWIAAGARWPQDRVLSPYEFTSDARAGFDWWSLARVQHPQPPTVRHAAWVRNPIDAFVAQGLEARGLAPSPEADRATLVRRATFDLLGLPPTPEEVDAFVVDNRPDAYERLIDRLLASPRYGERWARHWLDVVRFGETDGYETNKPRANAWQYRDYVIRALNEDRPYTQFILDQLAGEQTGEDAATGFLVGGTHDVVGIANLEGQLQQRANDLDDMLSTTATAFLGLSAGCARCHDHKFDPITHADYHALKAIFAGVKHGEREIKPPDYKDRLREEQAVRQELAAIARELAQFEPLAAVALPADGNKSRPPVHPLGNVDRFAPTLARFVRFTVSGTNQSEPCVDELEIFTAEANPRNVALASAGAKATASGVYADGASALHKLEHVNDGRYGNGRSWISSEQGAGWVTIELAEPAQIDRVAWARDREGTFKDRLPTAYKIELAAEPDAWRTVATGEDRRPFVADAAPEGLSPKSLPPERAAALESLLARRKALEAKLPTAGMQKVYAGTFDPPEQIHRLHRGDVMQKREAIAPGGIAAVRPSLTLPADTPEAERRQALARWIGDADNPLTARVLVNRVWHYHFGQGLVATPSNLGFHGGQPSHAELLDWLASEFVAGGWRIKSLHRAILLSATYRQASASRGEATAVDAGGRLLWRYTPRRLEAEPIRDAILAVSGRLDLRMGGPGYDAFEPNDNYVHVYQPRRKFGPAEWRRMVYQQKPRVVQDATFGVFDCPDASQVAPRRTSSTTAIQALNLLNSSFVVDQAGHFAERLKQDAGEEPSAQVRRGFRLALGRDPSEHEQAAAVELVRTHGLPAFCRALYNANEFVFVE